MNPLVLLGIGAAALIATASKKQERTAKLEAGTYRVTMKVAPVSASVPLSNLFVMPHLTMAGTGGVTVFESLTIDPRTAVNEWTLTGLMQYGGAEQTVNLLPGMTVERL